MHGCMYIEYMHVCIYTDYEAIPKVLEWSNAIYKFNQTHRFDVHSFAESLLLGPPECPSYVQIRVRLISISIRLPGRWNPGCCLTDGQS